MTDQTSINTEGAKDADAAAASSDDDKSAEAIWDEFEASDTADPADEPSPEELSDDGFEPTHDDKSGTGDADSAATAPEGTPRDSGAPDDPTPAPHSDTAAPDADLEKEVARLKGQISGQSKKIASLLKERQRYTDAISAADQNKDGAETRKEAMANVKDEYGDIIGPFAEQVEDLERKVESLSGDAQGRVEQIDQELQDIREREGKILTDAHPDFNDVLHKNKTLFNDWIEDQPKVIRDAHDVNAEAIVDGEAAAFVMSNFKAALAAASGAAGDNPNPPKADHRSRQLDGARSSPSRPRQAATSNLDPDSGDRQAHWDEFERKDAKKAKSPPAW